MPRARSGRSRDRRRRWTLAIAYTCLIASCDSPLAPDIEEVLRVDVSPAVLTMVVGGSANLIARVYGVGETILPAAKVFWSTQDPTVVTVDQQGVVSAVAAGTAQIAASSGGQSRTIAVTVAQRPIALVRINPPAGNVVAGGTLALTGEALDGTGALLPNRPLEWTTSAPTIATVSNTGVVTGVAVGEATISASGEGKVGTAVITVLPSPVVSITVQPNGGSLPAGGTMMLTATPRDGAGQPLTGRSLEWRSSNDAVATVSASGLLTAISPGVVTITVSAPGAGPNGTTPTAVVTVTVLIEPVASAVLVPSPASLQVGQTVTLTVNLFDSGGEPLSPAGRSIAWSSSAPAIATVNSSGTVTAVAVGSATVTATITTPGQQGAVQATAQISVSNQPVASVVITPATGVVHVGYSQQFTAVARDANGQPLPGRPILWTSGNQGIAIVDAGSGVVGGVSQGTVAIRATSEGVQGEASVTVDLVRVSVVSVQPASATLMPAQTVQLTALPRDSAGNVITGTALGNRPTTWVSNNTAAATVSTAGLVTAVAQGLTNVNATIGGTAGQSVITVNPLPSASQLAIVTQPSASPQNAIDFPVQPVIQLKDASGNNVATAGIVAQAAIASGAGTLGGTLTATTNASGTATFSDLRITGTTGIRTLTFTSGALTPATSGNVDLQPGTATQLALTTPPPSTANSGQVFSSATVVRLRDVSGNNVLQAGIVVTATVSPSAGVTLAGGSATTSGTGTATFSALTLNGPAGNYTLTFSSGSLTPVVSGTIVLSAGSGSRLSLTVQPSPTVQSGVAFPVQPVVQLRDASNNPVSQAGVVVSVAILSGGGTLGGTTTATTNASGVATFSGLSISGTIGVRTLLFGAMNYTTVTSNNVNVTAGPAAALVISVQPSSPIQSGTAFATQPSVQLRDASGNAVTQSGVVVTATLNGAGASLTGSTTATTNAGGTATFTGLGLSGTVGSYTISFSSGSLTGATSGSISLVAGAAAQLTITTQPAGATSGAAFTTQPRVQVRDAQSNLVSQSGITVTASIQTGPGGATLVGSATASTNGSGLATFSGLGISGTVGTYTLRFNAPSLTGVNSGSIVLSAGAAAQLFIVTQPAGASSGAAFTTQPAVQVRDAQSNPVLTAGTTITAAVTGGGASLVGSPTAVTTGSGTATFSGLGLSGTVGNYTLTFSATGLPNVVSGTIALAAGAAAQLTMATQPPASVVSGSAFSPAPAVQVRDGAGNPLTTNGISVSVAISAGGATLTGTTTQLTSNGIATFTGLGASGTPGSYTLSFSSGGLTGATSASFNVVAGSPSQLTITTQPAGAASGAAFTTQPRIQVRDAQNNPVSQAGISVTASIASGPGGATLVGSGSATTNASGLAIFSGLGLSGTVGSYTLTFASSGLTSVTSAAIALGPGAPALLTIVTQPAGASSGAAFTTQPAVQVRDAQSNPVTTAGIAVTAAANGGATLVGSGSASTNGSGVATFSGLGLSGTVGNYTVTFSSSGTPGVTSGSIALGPGAATQLTMSTQPSATVASGSALDTPPAVQLGDGAGNAVSQASVNVTVAIGSGASLTGSTSAATNASGIATFTGLGITGLVGNYTLSFSSGGLTGTTSSAITVTPGPATQLAMVTQPSATSVSGSPFATQPAVRLRDGAGNNVSQSGIDISAAVTGGGATLVGSATATTNGSGIATFSGLGINGVGTWTITFTSSGLTSVISAAIVVTEPATQLSMSSQPSASAQSGAAFAAQPAVQLRSAGGNPVNQSGVTITAEVTGGAASLVGTASALTNASGIATFTNLGISGTVGSYTLTFKSTGLSDAVSSAINLTAGAAAKLRIDQQPSATATSGAPFLMQPVIQLTDAQDNVVTTAGVDVTATLNGAGGTLNGAATIPTNSSGTAGYANLGITGTGNFTITFSATGLTGATSITISSAFFDGQSAAEIGVRVELPDGQVESPHGWRFDSDPNFTNWNWLMASPRGSADVPRSRRPETGSLSGTQSVATHTPLATFSHLTIDQSGNHALRFVDSGQTRVVSNSFAASS